MFCFTFNSCLSCFITGHLLNICLNKCEINAELKPRYIKKKNGKKTVKVKSDGSRSAGRFRLLFHLFYYSPHERIVDLLNFSPLQKKKEEEEIIQRQLQREKSIQAQDFSFSKSPLSFWVPCVDTIKWSSRSLSLSRLRSLTALMRALRILFRPK